MTFIELTDCYGQTMSVRADLIESVVSDSRPGEWGTQRIATSSVVWMRDGRWFRVRQRRDAILALISDSAAP